MSLTSVSSLAYSVVEMGALRPLRLIALFPGPPAPDPTGKEGCGGGGLPFQRPEVDPVQPEPGAQPLEPLVVVHQGPPEVPADVDPFPDQPMDHPEVVSEVGDLPAIVGLGGSILGDDDGNLREGSCPQHLL